MREPKTPDWSFVRACHDLITGVLVISDALAGRVCLDRRVFAPSSVDRDVLVPDARRLSVLKAAVSFSRTDLANLFPRRAGSQTALSALTTGPGNTPLSSLEIAQGPGLTKPLIRLGEELVVAFPGLLLAAARHRIVEMALAADGVGQLVEGFVEAVWRDLDQSLKRLDHARLKSTLPDLSLPGWRDGFFRFDTDKVLYVSLITDPLDSYDAGELFGKWKPPVDEGVFGLRAAEIRSRLNEMEPAAKELMWLVILQGVGRAGALPLPETGITTIAMSAEELSVISYLEGGQSLTLWKYASALSRLSEQTRSFAFDELDRFGLFRGNDYSFYLSDERPPNFLSVAPDYTVSLHQEVARRFDPHWVASLNGHLTEVVLLHGESTVPAYVPLTSVGNRPEIIVEKMGLPIWIRGDISVASTTSEYRRLAELVDAIAYWIWELRDLVSPVLRETTVDRVIVTVRTRPDHPTDVADLQMIVVRQSESAGSIEVEVSDDLDRELAPEGDGERILMEAVLAALLGSVSPKANRVQLDGDGARLYWERGPTRLKKRLFAIDSLETGIHPPGGLPPYRPVQKADQSEVLSLMGGDLQSHWPLGPIRGTNRSTVLNEAVKCLYERLSLEIAALSPIGLLEWLIRANDAIAQAGAMHRLQLPYRLACFTNSPELIRELKDEMPELASAAMSCRFLIEYVASVPPTGSSRMSLSTYDRLLALAAGVIGFGLDSDFVFYGLTDLGVAMLPSGRLGIDRRAHKKAMDGFVELFAHGEVARSTAEALRDSSNLSTPPSAIRGLAARIDEACADELGESLTSLMLLFGEAAALSEPSYGLTVRPLESTVAGLSNRLGWESSRTQTAIEDLRLRTRTDFLEPHPPFVSADVYPWRFNRSLSYLRRPFIERESAKGVELLWSGRHVLEAARYLRNLCGSGRLKTTSSQMRRLMSEMNNLRGNSFTDAVADRLEGVTDLVVRRRVKQMGGIPLSDQVGNLGDIDVLVVNRRLRVAILVECKDLALARTPAEMSTEVKRLTGRKPTTSSIDKIQERRAVWFRKNLTTCLESLGLKPTKGWRVEPVVAVRQESAVPFLTRVNTPVLTVSELVARLTKRSSS